MAAMTNSEAKASLALKLKNARKHKRITKQKIAKQLHVPISTISQIEGQKEGEVSEANLYGLSKKYADLVAIDHDMVAKELEILKPSPTTTTKKKFDKKSSRVFVASKATYALIAGVILTIFLSYILWQAWQLAAAPSLEVYRPKSNTVVTQAAVEITGKSSPDASVLVNGDSVSLDSEGNFSITVYVQKGQNFITVESLNSFGRKAQETILVVFQ